MDTRFCSKCGIKKGVDDFHRNSQKPDGRDHRCKECKRDYDKFNYDRNVPSPEFVEKRRISRRVSYHKLGHKGLHNFANKVSKTLLPNVCRDLKSKENHPPGTELHHWNYNKEFVRDVIPLHRVTHRRIHKKIKFDEPLQIFRTLDDVLLDTKEKHLSHISQFFNEPIPESLMT